jgi:hypothetical protein
MRRLRIDQEGKETGSYYVQSMNARLDDYGDVIAAMGSLSFTPCETD